MTARPLLSRILFWISLPLAAASLCFTVLFGIDAVPRLLAPPRASRPALPANAGAVETAVDAAGTAVDLFSDVSGGIVEGLFLASLTALAVSIALYWLSRKLRPPAA